MFKDITFTNKFDINLFPPKPAIKDIPDWYINTNSYSNLNLGNNEKKIEIHDQTPSTIKKCVPVFDAMTFGYILYTQVDVQIDHKHGIPYYTWPSQEAIAFHPVEQAPLHPQRNELPYPKWMNPYAITTPPGYSVFIIQPVHRESIFTILPGVVDTDKYSACINFPFVLNDVKWEGIIEAGTPIAQVIPFKRDSWKNRLGSEKEIKELNRKTLQLRSLFFNSYKKQFWSKKEFR
jgi:hypothetical protein